MNLSKDKENVLIVGVDLQSNNSNIDSSMNELSELVKAAGGIVVSQIIQKRKKIDPAYFIGKGKAEEIANYCKGLDIDTVIFNDELSGAQLRNLEELIKRKIIDRTTLILDIFANRATTKEGKLQVELAQLKYRLPRLIGLGEVLSRTGAGIGTRGPGEKKLEIDRRHILKRISEIERQLKKLKRVRKVKRKKRQESNLPIVALVGYTNAGKSTLLNTLASINSENNLLKEVFTKDMLFATLETTLRKGKLPNGRDYLITDTIGFVSKLPTHLVEAFKGTLEEVEYADLLLHVVDITNRDLEIQIETTLNVLKDLDVLDKPIITVFNKIDKSSLKEILPYQIDGPKVYISAKTGQNLDELLNKIQDCLPQKFYNVLLSIPYNEGNLISYIFDNAEVLEKEYTSSGVNIKAKLNEIEFNKYRKFVKEHKGE
ncbi:GTPase HflX [Thermohalobacter berrensis]|uniref:GTPase HflX n=1 Tax=Thermohalobacter berrensis TaxID=99594 RepID=A0A419TB17_9FIRM|nr:GTPase HflX [Thermohalobacter berrensis]RKD34684.1 GTPase HflX [Thermohalobacter berrensis]